MLEVPEVPLNYCKTKVIENKLITSGPNSLRTLETSTVQSIKTVTETKCSSHTETPNTIKLKKRQTIKDHIIIFGGKYKCVICDKVFASRQQQYYHSYCNLPLTSLDYKCKQCDRVFAKKSHLKYHKKNHTSKNNTCNICNKVFLNKVTLKKHKKLHRRPKCYKCNVCQAEYRDESSLKSHVRIHHLKDPKQFYCEVCGKGFFQKSKLARHSVIHNQNRSRPFKCQICGFQFYRSYHLKDHLKKHDNVTKYKCDVCCKYFSSENVLKRHINSHHDAAQYQCNICYVIINRKDNLLRHIRNMHSESEIEQTPISVKDIETPNNKISERTSTITSQMLSTNENQSIIQNISENQSSSQNVNKDQDEHLDEGHHLTNENHIIQNQIVAENEPQIKIGAQFSERSVDLTQYQKSPIDFSVQKLVSLDSEELNSNEISPISLKAIECSVIKTVGSPRPLDVVLSPKVKNKNLPNILLSGNPINISALANKKLRKKYDPSEMYRKILFVNNDTNPKPGCSKDIVQETEETNSTSNSNDANVMPGSNEDTTGSYSNFNEKHWRKNFYN